MRISRIEPGRHVPGGSYVSGCLRGITDAAGINALQDSDDAVFERSWLDLEGGRRKLEAGEAVR